MPLRYQTTWVTCRTCSVLVCVLALVRASSTGNFADCASAPLKQGDRRAVSSASGDSCGPPHVELSALAASLLQGRKLGTVGNDVEKGANNHNPSKVLGVAKVQAEEVTELLRASSDEETEEADEGTASLRASSVDEEEAETTPLHSPAELVAPTINDDAGKVRRGTTKEEEGTSQPHSLAKLVAPTIDDEAGKVRLGTPKEVLALPPTKLAASATGEEAESARLRKPLDVDERLLSGLVEISSKIQHRAGLGVVAPKIFALLLFLALPLLLIICIVYHHDLEFRHAADDSDPKISFNQPAAHLANQAASTSSDSPMRSRDSPTKTPLMLPDNFNARASFAGSEAGTGSHRFFGGAPADSVLSVASHASQRAVNTLCPDLVVPEGSECAVVVPRLATGSSSDFTVDDLRGGPVFRASFSLHESKSVSLMSVGTEVVFAAARSQEGKITFYRGPAPMSPPRTGPAPFAELHMNLPGGQGGYTAIVSANGDQIRFRGEPPGSRVCMPGAGQCIKEMTVMDKQGRLLALVERQPHDKAVMAKRLVRVGPLVDVGFIVLALLSIDML